jgi:hypothetical protein
VVGIQPVLTAIVTLWFLLRMKNSLLGNLWMTVSQLAHGDTAELVVQFMNSTGQEVRRMVKIAMGPNAAKAKVGIDHIGRNGAVGISIRTKND